MAISFLLPDGKYLSKTAISTISESRFISGTYDEANTVDLEVSIRGKAFASNPDLISFTAGGFVIPNPEAYPEGLDLFPGSNLVKVQSTNLKGQIGDEGQIDVILVGEDIVGGFPTPPSGITVESYRNNICLKVVGPTNRDDFLGFNFYAAIASGGGDYGYRKINVNLVNVPEVYRTETSLAEMDVDLEVARDEDGNLLKSPQILQIIAQQSDYGTQEVLKREVDEALVLDDSMDKLRLNMKVAQYRRTNTYIFNHDRRAGEFSTPPTISNNDFAAHPESDPLYYVVTSVFKISGVEVESVYSVEVEAKPQPVLAQSGIFPKVDKDTILQQLAGEIYNAHPEVAMHPGTVIRDVVVDPLVNENERLRLIIDFLHRSSSFHTLMRVDDPSNTGTSIAVENSPYKQALANALYISDLDSVQALFNGCYDKLAANYGVVRKLGEKARGEVTFYTKNVDASVNVPLGTRVSGAFLTTASVNIPFEDKASFYNPTTKNYQVTVGVVAINVGSSGNRNAGALSSTTLPNISVKNYAPTFGGRDAETNLELANRALVKIASVDTGTDRGYYQAVASVPGVEEALCISAGSPLMCRDFDADYGKNLGGKIDMWIRGSTITDVFDTFAFTFEMKQDVQFELVHLDSMTFRILDPALSLDNPVMEVLDYQTPRLGLQNASTGQYFDLEGVEIVDYNIIRLNTNIDQPSVDYTDVVLGDYRYRTGSKYHLSKQPVTEIYSMTGTVAGNLDESIFTLVRANPPTTVGYSAEAEDYVQVTAPIIADDNITVPTGELITVTDETHVLVGEYLEYVNNLGAVNLTIQVTSSDGATVYRGPYDPSGVFDYTIVEGTQTSPLAIKRVEGRDIPDGETVLISYKHDENFTVRYSSNLVVTSTQEEIGRMKHLAADVLIKEAIPIYADITATIVAKRGYTASECDASVRVSLANLFASLRMGDPIRQSDVIEAIDSAKGVSYVVLPMTKMALSDGSYVIQESLSTDQAGDHSLLLEWSTPKASVFLIHETLNHSTSSTGGKEFGNYRMVEKDGFLTDLLDHAPQLVGSQPDQSFIIGAGGLPIPNYSDDETIRSQGYVTDEEIQRRRSDLTGNKILISLPVGQSPKSHEYKVTYGSSGDTGTNDLQCSPASYFVLGEVTLSFDEDRSHQITARGRSY